MGISTDTNTLKRNWVLQGLDVKYGAWVGSPVQWRAYEQNAKSQYNTLKAQTSAQTSTQTPTQTTGGTTGVTYTPQTISQVSIGSTDLSNIINEFSTGTSTNPEVVIAQKEAQLLTDEQNRALTETMDTLQQNLAARGMTFSGIRTKEEESVVADNLAKVTGISIDLSKAIISAARNEQSKRESALQQAQQIQYNSLLAMGYVIDPTTGQLSKTLEKQQMEYEQAQPTTTEAPTVIGTSETGYYQWNTQTGKWECTGITSNWKATFRF